MPLESLTRAIFLKAELGFFGVVVVTFRHTPLLKGAPLGKSDRFLCKVSKTDCKAGDLLFFFDFVRPFRTSWFIVGILKIRNNNNIDLKFILINYK